MWTEITGVMTESRLETWAIKVIYNTVLAKLMWKLESNLTVVNIIHSG